MRQAIAKTSMVFVASALLGACGGGGIHPTIGGKVSGLESGASVILQNNYAENLEITSNGSFTFATRSASDTRYNVTVSVQPRWQKCVVSNWTGNVDAVGTPVDDIAVNCAYTASIGGEVSGLAEDSASVTLVTNGVVAVSSNGKFSFPKLFAAGSAFDVSVTTQPAGQHCTVENPTGIVEADKMAWVKITCV